MAHVRTVKNRNRGMRFKDVLKLAIEASHNDWWRKYVGLEGKIIGMKEFGDSAPGPVLQKHYGFDKENIIEVIKSII